jgi:hypothetical protein
VIWPVVGEMPSLSVTEAPLPTGAGAVSALQT